LLTCGAAAVMAVIKLFADHEHEVEKLKAMKAEQRQVSNMPR